MTRLGLHLLLGQDQRPASRVVLERYVEIANKMNEFQGSVSLDF